MELGQLHTFDSSSSMISLYITHTIKIAMWKKKGLIIPSITNICKFPIFLQDFLAPLCYSFVLPFGTES